MPRCATNTTGNILKKEGDGMVKIKISYGVHNDTPLSSGTIVTGRIVYDAFVLDNKKSGIYYHPIV